MYKNNTLGVVLSEDEALEYALAQCGIARTEAGREWGQFKEYFLDWYFSDGRWFHVPQKEGYA